MLLLFVNIFCWLNWYIKDWNIKKFEDYVWLFIVKWVKILEMCKLEELNNIKVKLKRY